MSLFNSFEISVNALHEQVNRGYEEESSEDEKADCLSEVINLSICQCCTSPNEQVVPRKTKEEESPCEKEKTKVNDTLMFYR